MNKVIYYIDSCMHIMQPPASRIQRAWKHAWTLVKWSNDDTFITV